MSYYRKVESKWCEICKIDYATEVHHIKSKVFGGKDSESNLIDVCRLCHKWAQGKDFSRRELIMNGGPFWIAFLMGIVQTVQHLDIEKNPFLLFPKIRRYSTKSLRKARELL